MIASSNESAYLKSRYQFKIRPNPIGEPGEGQVVIEVGACGVCGTDLHIADRLASDWQTFGHEVAGTIREVGAGVDRFKPGDRVALDSSAPCGKCDTCLPVPFGRGRPDLCPRPATYYGTATMGFGRYLLSPHQCVVPIPDSLPIEVACLTEPVGVSLDLTLAGQVTSNDRVLVMGPGPLGLGAVAHARRLGAAKIWLAGRSASVSRMKAGLALGADELIETDKESLAEYDFGGRGPDKILVTTPPPTLKEAIRVASFGATIAFIGIALGPETNVEFDVDAFHFKKLCLRASHASPGTHAAEVVRILDSYPDLGRELISHRFPLAEIASGMTAARDDKAGAKKVVIVP